MSVIVAANETAALQLLKAFPWLPGVEGDSSGLFLGPPNVEGGDAPRRCMWGHKLTEGQEDMLRAIIKARGAEAYFELLDAKPDDWQSAEPQP